MENISINGITYKTTKEEINPSEKFISFLYDENDEPVYGVYTCMHKHIGEFESHYTTEEKINNRHLIFDVNTCYKIFN